MDKRGSTTVLVGCGIWWFFMDKSLKTEGKWDFCCRQIKTFCYFWKIGMQDGGIYRPLLWTLIQGIQFLLSNSYIIHFLHHEFAFEINQPKCCCIIKCTSIQNLVSPSRCSAFKAILVLAKCCNSNLLPPI